MDTKWKNIKYNKATKAVALALAILMFFLAGNFAGLFIKGFANFNIFAHPEDFTNTASFRGQMNGYIIDALRVAEKNNRGTFEEWLQTERAKEISARFDDDVRKVTDAMTLLDNSGINVYVDAQNRYRYTLDYKGVRYFFTFNGEPISYDQFSSHDFVETSEVEGTTTAVEMTGADGSASVRLPENNVVYFDPYDSGNTPEYVVRVSEALWLLNSYSDYTCYGECTLETVLSIVELQRQDTLKAEYDMTNEISVYANYSLEKVESVSYAVIAENGKVFTNCDVVATDSHEQIMQKLGADLWAEWVDNGNYGSSDTKNKTASGVYASLHDWLFGEWYGESVLSDKTYWLNGSYKSAYFSVDALMSTDAFGAISDSFDRYNKDASLTGLLFATVICLAIACALCIYLLSVAGKRADGSVKISFFDKVPVEINSVLGLGVMALCVFGAVMIACCDFEPLILADNYGLGSSLLPFVCTAVPYSNLIMGAVVALFFMIWTGLTASLIRNIRNKTFSKHSLLFIILKPVFWIFRKLWNWLKKTVDKLKYAINCDYSKGQSTKFKVLACVAVSLFAVATGIYYFVCGVMMVGGSGGFAFLLCVLGALGDIAIALFVIMLIVSLDRIMAAVSDIRKGETGKEIDTKFMPPFMRRFAEDVLCMQDGLQNAVDRAVKDQRMKAELITNVSHDLKTPLTSIVNYVDLLKKCEIENDTAQKYISVLDEKSHKMKKLIEDLVEASKASSGAMEIHPVKLNLCEFATQAVGEYDDELKKYNIEIVLRLPENPVMVMADAQKVSRVMENLFSNIRKYALEGTRVYVDVAAGKDYGSVIFRNISKNPLDISAEELTQRFVRGDSSRSGDGSGLGLSIAKSLCELQNGKLGIQTDGDLFKATVALPMA